MRRNSEQSFNLLATMQPKEWWTSRHWCRIFLSLLIGAKRSTWKVQMGAVTATAMLQLMPALARPWRKKNATAVTGIEPRARSKKRLASWPTS